MSQMNENEEILLVAHKVLYNSLAQAILKLFQKSHSVTSIFFKLFWLICILISIVAASYMVIQSILTYLSYEVITTTRTSFVRPALFPQVTICNLNVFTTREAFEAVQVTFLNGSKYRDENDRIEFYSNFSRSLNQTLIRCKFNAQYCTSKDFVEIVDPYYGKCFAFNSDGNDDKKTFVVGSYHGLNLEIYIGFHRHLRSFNSQTYGNGLGLIVRIANKSYIVDQAYDGIHCAGGFHTDISMERALTKNLPEPYSRCVLESENVTIENFITKFDTKSYDIALLGLILESRYYYKRSFCMEQCYQKRLALNCGCRDENFVSLFNNTPLCLSSKPQNETVKKCYTDMYEEYINNKLPCQEQCPLQCYISKVCIFFVT
jgi:hypothetical protein